MDSPTAQSPDRWIEHFWQRRRTVVTVIVPATSTTTIVVAAAVATRGTTFLGGCKAESRRQRLYYLELEEVRRAHVRGRRPLCVEEAGINQRQLPMHAEEAPNARVGVLARPRLALTTVMVLPRKSVAFRASMAVLATATSKPP